MAQKLHDTYGYSYDNLKVLLGGWNTWKQDNATDPNAYPIETTSGATLGAGSKGGIVITGPSGTQIVPTSTP